MTIWDILPRIAPELILINGSLVLLLVTAFVPGAYRFVSWAAVALFAAAGLALLGPAGDGGALFDGKFLADPFSAFAKALIYFASAVAVIVAGRYFERDGELRGEYPVLIGLSAVGMSIMVSASDLLMLYIGLELQSLAAYVLASFARKDGRSAEAGLKYFVLGALASGILLYGMSLLYGFSGSTSFAGISKAMSDGLSTGEMFGLVFVFAGLAFKISAVPFHMWTPDVYEGAPTPVTAFFASAPKVAAMALLTRLAISAMGTSGNAWQQIVIFMALASIVLGAVAAINQPNIKRLLAYSSINNVGFALIGLAAGTAEGVASVMSYLFIYIIMTVGSFVCVLQMRDKDGNPVETIASLSGLSRTRPGLAAAFAIFMFSLAGIPPLFGFWAKFLVFDAAVGAGLTALAAVGIAASVIGAYYYLRVIKTIYFDPPAEAYAVSRSPVDYAIITGCAAVIVVGYLLNPWLGEASAAAAASLF
jgi:NADH-quinone oxidoreductase subunit N